MHEMTAANLRSASAEEPHARGHFRAVKDVAGAFGVSAAVQSMGYAISPEKIHATMYTKAKAAVDAGGDVELGPVQICSNCGHTIEGDAPDVCPICNVKKQMYHEFA